MDTRKFSRIGTFVIWTGIAGAMLLFMPPGGCEAARDASRFCDAELLEDGRTVLFTYADSRYRMKSGSLFGFGGGRAHYIRDRKIIGLYRMDNRKTEVLLTFRQGPDARGQGNFTIRGTRGRKAYLTRSRTFRGEAQVVPEQYILDVDTTSFTRIPIQEEMAELGMEDVRSVWLADGNGSLVMLAYAPGQKDGQKNSVPLGHVWLRRNSGQYLKLTEFGSYSGASEGEVRYYDHYFRERRAYNPVTGAERTISNREYGKYTNTRYGKPYRNTTVSVSRDGDSLVLYTRTDGVSRKEPFPIDMGPLR